jgi:hypothetical protein
MLQLDSHGRVGLTESPNAVTGEVETDPKGLVR